MAAISTIIAGVAAGIAAAGTGYGIVAGEEGKKRQEQAMAEQKVAQEQQATAARSAQRRSEMAQAAANRRQPNIEAIVRGAEQGAAGGPASTMLTGPTGVNPQDLALGRSTLLGG